MRSAITPTGNTTRSIEVIIVRSPACHLCEDAIRVFDETRGRFRLDVRVVEIDSKEGRAIVTHHRPPLLPAVLIDGRLFSSGRLPGKKLQRMLERVT